MLLPHRNQAYIPPAKLMGYLLSESHDVGKSKAKFLRGYGFDESNVTLLEKGLLRIAQNEPVKDIVSSLYGTKYIIHGLLETPYGTSVMVQTVWIVEIGEDVPRFVTAYPA